ncbi:MAG TPA: 30S ribosomal protein S3 [Dehalococcoidia bacterium]|nr:30S ribosomal protein S3 [Dehalococcoidia bacterium]
MGQKVHPYGFRLGVTQDWQAKWFEKKHYTEMLLEDMKLRKVIAKKCVDGGVASVIIERQGNEIVITMNSSRPGVVIGRGGQRAEELRAELEKACGKKVRISIKEIDQPELESLLVARNVADQLMRRIAFRRVMKQTIFRTMQAGARGIKVSCAGRLGGNEIARRETSRQGRLPLHTLSADISYGFAEADTTMGKIGIKVWIYKGDIIPEVRKEKESATAETGEVSKTA